MTHTHPSTKAAGGYSLASLVITASFLMMIAAIILQYIASVSTSTRSFNQLQNARSTAAGGIAVGLQQVNSGGSSAKAGTITPNHTYNTTIDKNAVITTISAEGNTKHGTNTYKQNLKLVIHKDMTVTGPGAGSHNISIGDAASCMTFNRKAYCWGKGAKGQLGNGGTSDQLLPVSVATGSGSDLGTKPVSKISMGRKNSACAIAEGKLYCWGSGQYGKLGNGSTGEKHKPTKASDAKMGGRSVTDVDMGGNHSCAIAGGQAYCWGHGNRRAIGAYSRNRLSSDGGRNTDMLIPRKVDTKEVIGANESHLTNSHTAMAITAGYDHSCTSASGTPLCWGYNGNGETGARDGGHVDYPRPPDMRNSFGRLPPNETVVQMDAHHHTCVVTAAKKAYCWGGDLSGSGVFGTGKFDHRQYYPNVVAGALAGKAVTKITTGKDHTCAIANGKAYCWGSNSHGQLGDGGSSNKASPVAVSEAPGSFLRGKTVTDISAGIDHTCAIADDEVFCWGNNAHGQLGDGTRTSRRLPTPVNGLPSNPKPLPKIRY